jgi:hypothetical protein
MSNLLRSQLQRSAAIECLNIVQIKAFVPREVEDKLTHYKTKIVEIVFDPLRIEEVNAKFKAAGFELNEKMGLRVVALNYDGSILVWGGWNSLFHLRPGEHITGVMDAEHLAFQDLSEFFDLFEIRKNKKAEIDSLIDQFKKLYGED